MAEICNLQYYTLDKIAPHRLEYIRIRLKWFIGMLGIKYAEWPLDCTRLLQKMKATQVIPFEYGFFRLSEKYEAVTDYSSDHNVYLMQINRNKVNYPFETSSDRRLNFTLAHEIGHIMLDHLKVPRELKSKKELSVEENEADEFAGRLLLPDFMLLNCNYTSLDSVAQFFMVSKTALWMRLNNMKRLDLLRSRRADSCGNCGNVSFTAFSAFCAICGQPVRNGFKGIRRIFYPKEIKTDRYKRVVSCPLCHSSKIDASGERCGICGTYIFNYCTSYFENGRGDCSNANSGNARFCESCGRPTYYYQKGLLRQWQEALDNSYVAEGDAVYG
jgi:Zn-dependent peptidase ImmA (M78 family)